MNAAPGAVDQARLILAADRYCILDVETTDLEGSIIEVAVIAADTGEVLFEELVNPGSVAFSAEAAAVHGIRESDLVGARQWHQVYPDLDAAIGDRDIAAYNSRFDFGRIIHDCNRIGVPAGGMGDPGRWTCLMDLRSSAHGGDTRLRLDGGHRALGDVHAARKVLLAIARGMAA